MPENLDPAPDYIRSTIAVLVETARRWPHVTIAGLLPMLQDRPGVGLAAGGTTLSRLVSLNGIGLDIVEAIETALPDHRRVDLDVGSAAVLQRLAAHRLAGTAKPGDRAEFYQALARRLKNAGATDQALAAAEEAVHINRALDGTAEGGLGYGLAMSLGQLASLLDQSGRSEQALAADREAVEILRRLEPGVPQLMSPALASALQRYASHLSSSGHLEEALAIAREALLLRRQWTASDRLTHHDDLAGTLSILCGVLDAPDGTTKLSTSARKQCRNTAGSQTRKTLTHTPDLDPRWPTWPSSRKQRQRRRPDPRAGGTRALPRPQRYQPSRVQARLRQRAEQHRHLHRRGRFPGRRRTRALAAAARLPRARSREPRRSRGRPRHGTEQSRGYWRSQIGPAEDPLTPIREAVNIWRRLAQANPAAHELSLGTGLNNLLLRLSEHDHPDGALAAAEHAVAIGRRLGSSPADGACFAHG